VNKYMVRYNKLALGTPGALTDILTTPLRPQFGGSAFRVQIAVAAASSIAVKLIEDPDGTPVVVTISALDGVAIAAPPAGVDSNGAAFDVLVGKIESDGAGDSPPFAFNLQTVAAVEVKSLQIYELTNL